MACKCKYCKYFIKPTIIGSIMLGIKLDGMNTIDVNKELKKFCKKCLAVNYIGCDSFKKKWYAFWVKAD